MKIGILQTGHAPEQIRPEVGDYEDMFARMLGGHGFEFVTFNVVDGAFPDSLDAAQGWIITGSRHGAYEDHAWIAPLEELIRAIYASGAPMLGICFGHQIIAQALGGKVEKFAGGWSVGRRAYEIEGETVALNAWHQDQVVALPEGAEVVGQNDFCKYAALRYDDRIYTIQPHPEFGAEVIAGLITHRSDAVPADLVATARAGLSDPLDNDKLAVRLAAFLKRGSQ